MNMDKFTLGSFLEKVEKNLLDDGMVKKNHFDPKSLVQYFVYMFLFH